LEVLKNFQQNGARIALSPFLREHVYSLTSRAGIKPVILPLIQVPLFQVPKAEIKETAPQ
jgi:preprotein translocase subunit SecB